MLSLLIFCCLVSSISLLSTTVRASFSFPDVHAIAKQVIAHPYPHVAVNGFLPDHILDQLDKDFPSVSAAERAANAKKGTGKDVLWVEPKFWELMARSAIYRELNDYLNSTAFMEWGLGLYSHHLEKGLTKHNCSVDPKKAFFEFYPEAMEVAKKSFGIYRNRKLGIDTPSDHDNNRIFSRLDFVHGLNRIYWKGAHEDFPHRILGILIYLDDLTEESGGEFELYSPSWSPAGKILPKRGMMLSHFSGWDRAIHGATLLNSTANPDIKRRYIHIQLSAHQTLCRTNQMMKF
jgi:hypothetical protein